MERGYTKLWRKTWDSEFFFPRGHEFSRFEAWMDIVNRLAVGVDTDQLKRGEFEASVRDLAKRWRWSKSRVERFLRTLCEEAMICCVKDTAGHLAGHLKVCNYDTYNGVPGHLAGHPLESPSLKFELNPEESTTCSDSEDVEIAGHLNDRKQTLYEVTAGHILKKEDTSISSSLRSEDLLVRDISLGREIVLLEIFQAENEKLPGVRRFGKDRKDKCKARIKSALESGLSRDQYLQDFREAVQRAQKSSFLTGRNDTGWRCSFDWLIANDRNLYKILEGNYDDRKQSVGGLWKKYI